MGTIERVNSRPSDQQVNEQWRCDERAVKGLSDGCCGDRDNCPICIDRRLKMIPIFNCGKRLPPWHLVLAPWSRGGKG